MSDEQWLREGLADAVPEPPRAPDRARSARDLATRARRRTAAAVVVGGAAVVAAVAVGATAFDSDPDAPPAAGPTEVIERLEPHDPPACPPAPRPSSELAPPDAPDPDAPGGVPAGATSARLCAGVGNPFDVPEALVTDIDALTAIVNGLPEADLDPDVPCPADLGIGYRIAFGYPDGSQFIVSGQRYGCRPIVVGSTTRSGSDHPWIAFIDALRSQRDSGVVAAPQDTVASDCLTSQPDSPAARPADRIIAAVVCEHVGRGPRGAVHELSDAEIAQLADLPRWFDPEPRALSCPPWTREVWAIAVTEWGDHIRLDRACGVWSVVGETLRADSLAAQVLDSAAGQ